MTVADLVPTRQAIRDVIEFGIVGQPRSQQVAIGPSEVGIGCDRCLAHKLSGAPKLPSVDWLPFVGTAVHAQFEQFFTRESLAADARGEQSRWCPETRVYVGDIDDEPIFGHCDLFDVFTGTVVDFKVVGKTTLTSARVGPSEQYRTQAHLYGRGWSNFGHDVATVAIWYLPRNATTLDAGVWWSEPYDETVATTALDRATALARAIEAVGAETVIPQLKRKPGCYDCPRYRPLPGETPLPVPSAFDDILGTPQ